DFGHDQNNSVLFRKHHNPDIQERLSIFKKEAPILGMAACKKILVSQESSEITHLITVTCTGLSAPGLDYELIRSLGLDTSIQRFTVNFMGCFAAFHALKLADTICKASIHAKVLVVCVELCTLHLHGGDDLESVVANAIFADGAAACLVSNAEEGLCIKEFLQDIVPSSSKEMAWDITSSHFLMKLSSYVPELIGSHIEKFCQKITKHQIRHHAVHPGGRKILESYQKTMGLGKHNLGYSYEVLENYGNMSSPTILFVLKKIMDSDQQGQIFASGFGPGLTMEGILLSKI
ncbi:MAG TPA: type III polyketide synthase, partial [Cytophagales bacterium]|nr:type III polyketide synthase [Cytophagales bacterium]